ncbi:MAG TPA: glycosyltransferase [bacterium]|nr:glycosyltransferase [bacterium]
MAKTKKLAFICYPGQETFIEPIVREYEKRPQYQVHRYYTDQQADVIAAVKWADILWLEWANQLTAVATQVYEIKSKSVIVRLHSYEALSSLPTRVNWKVVDYLVFVAPHIRDIVKMQIHDIEKQVCTKIIPNGLDIDNIPKNKVFNMYDIAYVCNLSLKKEPAMMLQIMAELVKFNPAFHLHSAGGWQDKGCEIYMKHMAKEMGIEENITYYGFVENMETFWPGKGILLSTSFHEGHPCNIMEGMARGLRPVIHNFIGAKGLYQEKYLFNTVVDAINMITEWSATTPDEKDYRKYVIDRGWTKKSMMASISKLIRLCGKKA